MIGVARRAASGSQCSRERRLRGYQSCEGKAVLVAKQDGDVVRTMNRTGQLPSDMVLPPEAPISKSILTFSFLWFLGCQLHLHQSVPRICF